MPAYLVNMLCGSGLKSVHLAYQAIKAGESKIVISGGQESMSLAPHAIQLRTGVKYGTANLVDTLMHDGLTDAFSDVHMGITAENCSRRFGISRQQQDEYAARSQQLAETAQNNGYFDEEIVAVEIQSRTGIVTRFNRDEFPRHGTTVQGLSRLTPCFDRNGSVTPGNASGTNDSAAAVLLMSEEEVEKRSIKPLARIVAFGQAGVDPLYMGIGASAAVEVVVR